MAERAERESRRQYGFVSIGTALAVAAASAGMVIGDTGGDALLDLLPGTGWITGDDSVQRVNGLTGAVDGGIALTDDLGRALEIVQDGDQTYFRTEDGHLVRIEEATLGAGASVGLDAGTIVVEHGGTAWFLEPDGTAAGHDAVTLMPQGDPLDLGGKPREAAAAVDADGLLYAVPERTGVVVVADGADGEVDRHRVADRGHDLRLTRLDDAVVAIDADDRVAFEVRADGDRPAIALPGTGSLVTSAVIEGDDLWLVDAQAGLIRVDVSEGRSRAPISIGPLATRPGPPLVASGFVYVPVGDTLIAVDAATGERQRDLQLPADATLSVRDGLLIADGDGTNLVIHKNVALPVEDRKRDELPDPIPPDLPAFEEEPTPRPDPERPDPAPEGEVPAEGGGKPAADGTPPPPVGPSAEEPDAPENPEAFPGDESAVVTWEPPLVDGGSLITGYEVSYEAPTGGTVTRRYNTSDRSAAIAGLENGEPYVFSIRARNEVGLGASASTAAITPQAEIPNAPASAAASPAGRGAVEVSWTPPAGGTRALDRYDVECASGGAPAQTAEALGTADRVQVGGLVGGGVYSCSVRAVNDAQVASAPTVASDVVAQDVPAGPASVASPIPGGVRIDWSAPPANGSSITGYTVFLNGTGYASAGYRIDVGIARGGPYACSVVAHSNVGDGAPRACDGNSSSPNQPPSAQLDPANGNMGGFVWGPSEAGTVRKCYAPAPNILANDPDPEGDALSAHLISGGGIGPVSTVPGGYYAGSGQSGVTLNTNGQVTELCVTRNAAANLGTPLRLVYEARDGYGGASQAEVLFYLFCQDAGGTNGPC